MSWAVFTIPGKVATKGRPRFSTANGVPRTYTPANTVLYENLVKTIWMQSGCEKLDGCISAVIVAVYPIPKSISKKKREALKGSPYPHKGDCDNVAKIILDSLNGLAYDDDAQVTSLTVQKIYGDDPRAFVSLKGE